MVRSPKRARTDVSSAVAYEEALAGLPAGRRMTAEQVGCEGILHGREFIFPAERT
jgi:hypothetical protein